MHFLTLFCIIPAVIGVATVNKRATIDPQQCVELSKYTGVYHGQYYSMPCANLIKTCLSVSDVTNDPWGQASCVAAATCGGTSALLDMIQCKDASFEPLQAPNLNYDIYANIVGNCAWQDGGCPITQQNYVDFMFGQMSAIGSSSYPPAGYAESQWWKYVIEWAATGQTVPYTNFNDWLRYSSS